MNHSVARYSFGRTLQSDGVRGSVLYVPCFRQFHKVVSFWLWLITCLFVVRVLNSLAFEVCCPLDMPPRKKPRRQSTVPPDSSPGSSLTSNNNHFYQSSAQQTDGTHKTVIYIHTTMSSKRLSNMKEHDKPEPIEIRVVKTWIPVGKKQEPSSKSQTKSQSQELCYLFVDKHGDAIEAIADQKEQAYFDSIIKVQSCYRVNNYIVVESRKYMPTVQHSASLRIGKRARFVPLSDTNIPTQYFNFANYEEVKSRSGSTKLLTDFIGRVKKHWPSTTRTNKRLRKIDMEDDRENPIEITLWPEKRDLIGNETIPGDILAITSTLVTDFNGSKQLESTNATTIFVNPTFPEIQHHVDRLKASLAGKTIQPAENTVTVQELKNISANKTVNVPQSRFTCHAQIKEIYASRKWYYVQCSLCTKKLYQEKSDSIHFVCEDDENPQPKYMYCVNASIIDATSFTDVVFFNDVMTDMLGTTCEEMIIKQGYTDPKILPDPIVEKIGNHMTFNLTVKDKSIVVNKATDATNGDTTPTDPHTITTPPKALMLPPPTPNRKTTTTKRALQHSPDKGSGEKQAKY
ncbi:putative replication protein A, OB [Helianthus annuus]|nr:putative replication protein A, OB [Helianthus annuus]